MVAVQTVKENTALMSKINLELDFAAILKRIDQAKKGLKPGIWADMLGVSRNIVANVHGKIQQKPSLEYIVAVSKATGTSVDYYLWGKNSVKSQSANLTTDYQPQNGLSNITKVIIEHQGIVKRFKDPEQALRMNQRLIDIQDASEKLFAEVDAYIKGAHTASRVLKDNSKKTLQKKLPTKRRTNGK